MILYSNDYLLFEAEDDNVFLVVQQPGITMKNFSKFCENVPRLKLTKFGAAKEALESPVDRRVLIGQLKDEVEVSLSSDEMTAFITLNMLPSDYEADKKAIVNQILYTLKEEEITSGIKKEIFEKDLDVMTKLVIAEGVPPTHGKDAIIEYFEFCTKKPIVRTDGKVNHYELELIDNVLKGDWLGKKIPATSGEEGVSVKGNPVSAKSGRDYKLKFDPITINHKVSNDGSEDLYAKINGAAKMKNSRVCVDNHLIVHGDVEYTTGHIEFDGYVTVTGTVKDKFNVTATYDISINGPMGIGAIGIIESKKGSVLLKGGVNGKGVARIKAHRDVFTKYANEAIIDAGNNIHVGLYAMDSIMNAKKIILPPTVGRIIGGQAYAEHRIETGSIGNKYEKPTKVFVEGFERGSALEMLSYYKDKSESLIKTSNKLKRELEVFESNLKRLDDRAMTTYEYMLIKYDNMMLEINEILLEIQKLEDVLRTKGEGEVSITNSVFPKTILEIKHMQQRIKDTMSGSFYVQDKTLHHN